MGEGPVSFSFFVFSALQTALRGKAVIHTFTIPKKPHVLKHDFV